MVTHYEVQRQLKAIGANIKWWGRAEVRELEHILVPRESIMYCINGRYEGGFAMICITDQRILLIDKKPLYLSLEDIRYDMISEVDFNQRLLDATIIICTLNKKLPFTALKAGLLRKATTYAQGRIMEFRHQPVQQYYNHQQPYQQQSYQQQTHPQHMTAAQLSHPHTPQQQPAEQGSVWALEHRITNPYTRVPLMMRRRVSRYTN